MMHVTTKRVIAAASKLADEGGLYKVSLKAVAEELHIKTPSLYNHIGSLEELLRAVGHDGMRAMNDKMTKVAVGNSGVDAIKQVAFAYLDYMTEHPGIYEIIQWANWHDTEETQEIFGTYLALLTALINSCHLENVNTDDVLRILTGYLHGYNTLQLRNAYTDLEEVKADLFRGIDSIFLGLKQLTK